MPPDPGGGLPERVTTLLGVVDSLEKLELICRFHQHRDRAHRAPALAAELGSVAGSVELSLDELVTARLLSRDKAGGYWYAPTSDEVDAAVGELCRLYGEDPLRIIRIVTNAAFDRIRSSAARAFSDAFVIRRKRKPEEPNDG